MSIIIDTLQTLHRFGPVEAFVATGVGAVVCILGPLVHELGHLVPARIFGSVGRVDLLPFRALGGVKGRVVVAAIKVPDERFLSLTARKAGAVIAGDPIADLAFIACCLIVSMWLPAQASVGIVAGGAARAAAWVVNLIPIPLLGNDAARFLQFVWKRRIGRSVAAAEAAS